MGTWPYLVAPAHQVSAVLDLTMPWNVTRWKWWYHSFKIGAYTAYRLTIRNVNGIRVTSGVPALIVFEFQIISAKDLSTCQPLHFSINSTQVHQRTQK